MQNLTITSKDRDILNGRSIKLTRAKKLVGGKFYIRFYISASSFPYMEIVSVLGTQYKSETYDLFKICLKHNSYFGGSNYLQEGFISDLGLYQNRIDVGLYEFNHKNLSVIQELIKNNDGKNSYLLLGYTTIETFNQLYGDLWDDEDYE